MTSKTNLPVTPFGRLERPAYWLWMPAILVLQIGLEALVRVGLVPLPMSLPVVLILAWLSFTVLTRRLHDFGQNVLGVYLGWAAVHLLAFVVAAVVMTNTPYARAVGVGLGLLLSLGWLAILVWAGVTRGNPARNEHGSGGSASASRTAAPTGYLAP